MNKCNQAMDIELPPQGQYDRIVELFKTLANPVRLKIINILSQKPLCVCNIEPYFEISQAAISKHLKILVSAKIIEFSQEGAKNIYELRDNHIFDLLEAAEEYSKIILRKKLQDLQD